MTYETIRPSKTERTGAQSGTSAMNREEAIQAIMDGTGRTKEQADAFVDLLGSAFRRKGWVPGNPLSEEAIAERLDTFLGKLDREGRTGPGSVAGG